MTTPAPHPELPLVIVNGLGAPRLAAQLYSLRFRRQRRNVFIAPQKCLYYGDVRQSARLVARQVDEALDRTGSSQVQIVGMSLGGLIGHYYLACLGGAAKTECFISIGGPLSGSALARLGQVPPITLAPAVGQCRPGSEVMQEIEAAAAWDGVRLYAVGTRGDAITPKSAWTAPKFRTIETPHGIFPIGHWMLFTHPQNQRIVEGLLQGREPDANT